MTYPEGAYLTVRGLPDGWSAVIAVQGRVISRAVFSSREAAFESAISKAERDGLPALVEVRE